MRRIKEFLIYFLGVGSSLHQVHVRQKILETQLDFLIRNSGRKIRRRWFRMLNRRTSPNYIGDVYKDLYSDSFYRSKRR